MITISQKKGRVALTLTAFEMGNDICVILTGGEEHLGAVTVGSPQGRLETVAIGSHKEYYVTEKMGQILESAYSGSYVICCGIHLDNITKDEIATTIDLSGKMVEALCKQLNSNNAF